MKDYQEQLETLQKWIDESKNIVFFGGAGVSTESGIPDFRSVDGLYNQQYKYPRRPSSAAAFLTGTRRNFTAFTATRCSVSPPSPMPPTKAGPAGSGGEAQEHRDPEH